jgi:tetratricopeptide (TPR) repeat protein/O-antigen ligase
LICCLLIAIILRMNREKTLLRIVTAGLYLAPLTIFLFLKHTIFPLVTLKVFSFHIVIEILVLFWLLLIYFSPSFKPKLKRLDYILLSLVGVVFLSGIFGVDFWRSFWSVPARGIGIFSLLHFFALFLVLKSLQGHFNWRKYISFLFFISLVIAFIAVWQRFLPGHLFQVISQSTSRPGSLLGNPSFLAPYLIFTVFLGSWLIATERKKPIKWIYSLGVLVEILVIFFTSTRGAILGLTIGVLWVLFLLAKKHFKERKKFSKNIFAIILIIIFVFGLLFGLTRTADFWQSVSGLDRLANVSFDDVTTRNRLITWGTAWKAFLNKPVLGWGWENFKYGFDTNYNTKLLSTGINETFWDKPHNTFFEYLTTTGAIGFLLYSSLLVGLFTTFLKNKNNLNTFGSAIVLGYAVSGLFIFDTFGSYLMLFIVFALATSNHSDSEDLKKNNIDKKPGALALVGVIIAAFVLIYSIFVNIQIVRANNLQYHGLNFILNELPEEGVMSYRKAISIKQPYQDQIRLSFLEAISDTVSQLKFSNIEDLISEIFQEANIAVSRSPLDYRNYIILAEAKTKLSVVNPSLISEVVGDVGKAIELSPNRQENYYALSQAYLRSGDQEEAYSVMKKAIDLDSQVGEPHFYYGLLALQLGDSETGWREIKLAEKLGREPQLGHEFRVLANFYGDAGEHQKAIEYYNRAIHISPVDFEAKLKLGIVYYYVDDFEKARALFEEVLKARPDFVESDNFESLVPIFRDVGFL